MKTSKYTGNSMRGCLYIVGREDLESKPDLVIQSEFEPAHRVSNGIIIANSNYGNEKIKFDLVENDDYHGAYCSGFLYPDKKFIGKVKYLIEAKLKDENIRGYYEKSRDGGIVIKGEWEDQSGLRIFFGWTCQPATKNNERRRRCLG